MGLNARPYMRKDELRIGGIFSLTGYLSWSGRHKRRAAELKVEMINERGGIGGRPLKLIAYDDQSGTDQAASIAEALVFKHRVVAMVGTGSLPISRAVARIANRFRTPAFINSGYFIDPANDLYVFNTAHKTEFAIACSFQYFLERGIHRLALLMPDGPLGDLGAWLGKRLADRMGLRIVGEERFSVADIRVASQISRLVSLKPQAFFSFVTGQPAASIANTMAAVGTRLPLLLSHGNANPRFLRMVSDNPVPIIVPSGKTMVPDILEDSDPCRDVVLNFNNRHLEKYGEPANYYSAELADAIDLFAEGYRQSGDGQSENLQEALENIKDFQGMQGNYHLSPIDHYGTGIEQIVLLTVRHGTWHFEKAFTSVDLFEDLHGNQKGQLIRKVTGYLPEPPDPIHDAQSAAVAQNGLNCTDFGPDPFFSAKLFCQQKLDLVRAVKSRDLTKAKSALSYLLTVTILQHFETPETLKLAVLELFLALFDAACEEGSPIEAVIRLRRKLIDEWNTAPSSEALCLWIIRALDRIDEVLPCATRDKGIHLRKRIDQLVTAHLGEDLSTRYVAREFGLSPSRLQHLLRNQCNTTLGACIIGVRMEAAKSLLRNSMLSIAVIGMEVGYKDQGYFTRVFKKYERITPQEYRKKAAAA
jgi:branched-chain amino acid transport system substrate-binding protein